MEPASDASITCRLGSVDDLELVVGERPDPALRAGGGKVIQGAPAFTSLESDGVVRALYQVQRGRTVGQDRYRLRNGRLIDGDIDGVDDASVLFDRYEGPMHDPLAGHVDEAVPRRVVEAGAMPTANSWPTGAQ